MATKYNNRIFFDVSCGDEKLTLSNKLKSLSPFFIIPRTLSINVGLLTNVDK